MAGATTDAELDPAAVAGFARDGFVVVPDLLDPGELARHGPAVDAAVALSKAGDTRALAEGRRYEQSFLQCHNLWEDSPGVRPLTFHPRSPGRRPSLLGGDAVRLWHDQALYKEAGGRDTDAHQDQPYWPIAEPTPSPPGSRSTGSTLASGAWATSPAPTRRAAPVRQHLLGEPEDLLADPGSTASSRRSSRCPRVRSPSTTASPRTSPAPTAPTGSARVHTMIYFADGCTRGRAPALRGRPPAVAVGDAIASPVTPIAWPRPHGDLPPTPAV